MSLECFVTIDDDPETPDNLIATRNKTLELSSDFHAADLPVDTIFRSTRCPGRHELDENQEIHHPAATRAVVETGYGGYAARESPLPRDPVASRQQSVKSCDV